MTLKPEYVTWTRTTIESLKIGGTWAIPMDGTVVTRLANSRVKIEGPGKRNEDLRSYINAAGFTIEGPSPRDRAMELFTRFQSEVKDRVTAAIGLCDELAKHYAVTEGVSGDEKKEFDDCLRLIAGMTLMEKGMCLFHKSLDVPHDDAHTLLDKAMTSVLAASPEVQSRPEAATVIANLLKMFD